MQQPIDLNKIAAEFIEVIKANRHVKWEHAAAGVAADLHGKMMDLQTITTAVLAEDNVLEAGKLMSMALNKAAWTILRREILKGIGPWYKDRLDAIRRGKELVAAVRAAKAAGTIEDASIVAERSAYDGSVPYIATEQVFGHGADTAIEVIESQAPKDEPDVA